MRVLQNIIFPSSEIFLIGLATISLCRLVLNSAKFTLKAVCTFTLKAALAEVDACAVVTRFRGTVVYY